VTYELLVGLKSSLSVALGKTFVGIDDCVTQGGGSIVAECNGSARHRDEVLTCDALPPLLGVPQLNEAPLQQRCRFLIIRILELRVRDRAPSIETLKVMHRWNLARRHPGMHRGNNREISRGLSDRTSQPEQLPPQDFFRGACSSASATSGEQLSYGQIPLFAMQYFMQFSHRHPGAVHHP
jgi:hypothetical protein